MLSYVSLAYQFLREERRRKQPQPALPIVPGFDPPGLWFHSIDLGNGQVTRGLNHSFRLRGMADTVFESGVAGKSVLDIGAWDGFFSFEAEKRGAARVLAIDHPCWSGSAWGTKRGFDYVHALRQSRVESEDVDLRDLARPRHGGFDVVLLLGVIYHLDDPYGGLKQAAALADDLLVVETVTACNTVAAPVMRFYLGEELDRDHTNRWAPNTRCLRQMLRQLGFRRIEIVPNKFSLPHVRYRRHFAFARR